MDIINNFDIKNLNYEMLYNINLKEMENIFGKMVNIIQVNIKMV